MWRPRDRERFVGSYDPEHEMPDPDRDPGQHWQSDAYRRGARDSRFAYRLDPDRFESRYDGPRRNVDREIEERWRSDARDRAIYESGYRAGYERGFDHGWNRDFDRERDLDRGGFMTGPRLDRDQPFGSDRGWDNERGPRRR